jgi:hypothetical protein
VTLVHRLDEADHEGRRIGAVGIFCCRRRFHDALPRRPRAWTPVPRPGRGMSRHASGGRAVRPPGAWRRTSRRAGPAASARRQTYGGRPRSGCKRPSAGAPTGQSAVGAMRAHERADAIDLRSPILAPYTRRVLTRHPSGSAPRARPAPPGSWRSAAG